MKKTPLKRNSTLKRGNSTLKKSKLKPKVKTEGQQKDRQELFERDKEFYMKIWNEMWLPRRCFETNKLLPREPLLTMFHHILYKSQYPEYRHEEWNIVVILPEIHALTHSDIDKTPKIKEYTKLVRDKYGN